MSRAEDCAKLTSLWFPQESELNLLKYTVNLYFLVGIHNSRPLHSKVNDKHTCCCGFGVQGRAKVELWAGARGSGGGICRFVTESFARHVRRHKRLSDGDLAHRVQGLL